MDPLYGNNSNNKESTLQNNNTDALEELNNFLVSICTIAYLCRGLSKCLQLYTN